MLLARRQALLAFALTPFMRSAVAGDSQAEPRATLRLLVIGDSLAQGLATTLYHRVRPLAGVSILPEGVHSTGFTRYHQLDWQARLTELLTARRVDAVAMWMGLNDFRPMVDPESRRRYDFNSPEWLAVYAARVDGLIEVAARARIPIFWLGMPVLRDATNNSGMRIIDAVQRERVERLRETWISTAVLTSAPDGGYLAFLEDARGPRRLRADDGAHFTELGYRIVADGLLAAIAERLPQYRPILAAGQ
ncbi:MAG: DUF459 domain-containing protein [Alphaproteobacteria bacterium]|nr:DUF459 domain-containing protein [Alphaproteobacteria bacterium]